MPLRSFDDAKQALAFYARAPGSCSSDDAAPSRRLDLNSTTEWRFKLYDKPESLPDGVTCPEFDDKDWAKVSVWERVFFFLFLVVEGGGRGRQERKKESRS